MSVKLDETGLHDRECPCMRCESGYRPSAAERWRAEAALQRRKAENDVKVLPKKERERLARIAQRAREFEEQRMRDADYLARFHAPSPKELRDLASRYAWAKRSAGR